MAAQTPDLVHSSDAPALAFSHVGLYAHDLAVMEDFYSRVLGFTVTDRGELAMHGRSVHLVFLSRNPAEHHQLVLASGRPKDLAFNVINQISFRLDGLPALRYFHRVLQTEHVSDLSPVSHGNAISLYFRDPERNRLELFFDTPWYCTQPCRESIDLSRSDEDIMAWTETLARSLPGFKTRTVWSEELRRKMKSR